MRLNRVNERRGNGNNPILLIAVGTIVIILLIIVGYFLFGTGSEEPGSQIVTESDNSATENPDDSATVIPRSVEPTLKPTRIPTAIPTPVPTEIPTIIPTATATATPTLPPTPVPTIDIAKSPLPDVVNDNPPHVFVGTVTIDGQLAPDGTEVSAWMLQYSEPVGSSIVPAVPDQAGSYSLLTVSYTHLRAHET